MKTAIVSKEGVIASIYDGAPDQSKYGGPWGRPEEFDHIEIPSGMIADASVLRVSEGVITEDSAAKTAYLAAAQQAAVKAAVIRAKQACADLEVEFMAGNSILGIKQDGLAVKQAVSDVLVDVSAALKVGDPDLVIASLKAIPSGSYDSKYVTAARLLEAANKIRAAMGQAAVSSLADA